MLLAQTCGFAYAADRVVVGWNRPPASAEPAQVQQAIGFTAEVIREAARRDAMQLEWRELRSANEVDEALDRGWIDVAPAAIPTPERRARFYVSEPWWNEGLAFVVRADGPQTEGALAGKRIALKNRRLMETARKAFPRSVLLEPESAGTGTPTSQVCRGQADAALMTHRDADLMIGSERPPVCAGVALTTLDSTATLGLVVMSRPEKAELARRLRRRIDRMTEDGTLAGIAARHPGIAASSAAAMAERMRQHTRQQALWIALYAMLGVLALAALALWRMHVIIQARKKAEYALKESERVLRQSNQDLQDYTYTVSHHLQEPLRMVTAFVDLLERRHRPSLDAEAREFMDVVRSGATRMSTMLDDLLEYDRAGQEEIQAGAVCAETAANRALRALEQQIAETGARISTGPLPVVCASERRIAQVFRNLIENALKYRRPDVTPEIRIEATRAGETWKFSVSDNGIGFDIAYADRIFHVFQRLHLRTEYCGNGIGLPLTRRIVERHGGRIWVEWAERGRGVRFCFTLPAVREQPAGARAADRQPASV